jgi:hypothetical protein
MDKTSILWVLECCILALDNVTKSQMLELGCSEELAEMGIKLCEFLKLKQERGVIEMRH